MLTTVGSVTAATLALWMALVVSALPVAQPAAMVSI